MQSPMFLKMSTTPLASGKSSFSELLFFILLYLPTRFCWGLEKLELVYNTQITEEIAEVNSSFSKRFLSLRNKFLTLKLFSLFKLIQRKFCKHKILVFHIVRQYGLSRVQILVFSLRTLKREKSIVCISKEGSFRYGASKDGFFFGTG